MRVGSGGEGQTVQEARFHMLLRAAKEGQADAWAEIYDGLAPSLLGYLRAQGAVEPEDLLGEVFLQMVRDIARFDGGAARFRAWAFTIAHHRLMDDRRYRARRPVDPAPPEALPETAVHADEPDVPGIADQPVEMALRRLPAEQRAVVLMRVIGDPSVADVARVLGKSPGAVKAAQRRAFASLKRQLTKLTVTL